MISASRHVDGLGCVRDSAKLQAHAARRRYSRIAHFHPNTMYIESTALQWSTIEKECYISREQGILA